MAVYKREGEKYWRVRFQWKGESVNRRTYATTRHAAHQIPGSGRYVPAFGRNVSQAVSLTASLEFRVD